MKIDYYKVNIHHMLIANILELRADPNNFLEGYLKLLHSPFNPTVYSAGSIFFSPRHAVEKHSPNLIIQFAAKIRRTRKQQQWCELFISMYSLFIALTLASRFFAPWCYVPGGEVSWLSMPVLRDVSFHDFFQSNIYYYSSVHLMGNVVPQVCRLYCPRREPYCNNSHGLFHQSLNFQKAMSDTTYVSYMQLCNRTEFSDCRVNLSRQ